MNLTGSYVAVFIVACVALQLWLFGREINFQKSRGCSKEANYAIAKIYINAGIVTMELVLLLVMTIGGGLANLKSFWLTTVNLLQLSETSYLSEILTLISVVLICALAKRGLTAHKQLDVDRRFNISKMSTKMFLKETIFKGAILTMAAVPLAVACVWAMETFTDPMRWVYVWLIWTSFDWARSWVYPATIAHMFDNLKDIDNPELRTRIDKLMQRSKCQIKKIEIVDTSHRTTHANANVVGLGNTKRVIIHDTLLQALTPRETVAVMAHELGHAQYFHVAKLMLWRSFISLIWIISAGMIITRASIPGALDIPEPSSSMLLAGLILLSPIVAIIAQPLTSLMCRTFEFQADHFVIDHDDPFALQMALNKLYVTNNSAQTTDNLYGFVYNTHPTLSQRLNRLQGI